jgi:uncharacterized NAD(P)/FAD-binding protein YdhS
LSQSGPRGPRVFLIEKSDVFGAGAAYATNNPAHLLNTRAGNMSAFPGEPDHFLNWLAAKGEGGPDGPAPSCFVSRHIYGQYLGFLLREAAMGSGAAGRFYLVPDEAVSLTRRPAGGFAIRLALGKDLEADAAVVATGNPPPHPPGLEDSGVVGSEFYVGDPWSSGAAQAIPKDGTVLLLGTGLTMIDFAIALVRDDHRAPVIALSRRGLLPHSHAEPPRQPLPAPPSLSANVVADLAALRRTVFEQAKRGRDWPDVMDALRPITAAYWRSLPLEEQRRFLRHLRPWWEIHRHRVAPEAAQRLQTLLRSGALEVRKGRLKALALSSHRALPVMVTWTPRASRCTMQFSVSRVINCMGPGNDPALSPLPLFQQMLKEGLIQPDGLGLGIAVDSSCRAIAREGYANPALFAIGPATRGTFWEVTAIPDIRTQAVSIAKGILAELARAGAR